MPAEPAREDVFTIHSLPPALQRNPEPIDHGDEVFVRYLRPIQIDHAIIEIDIGPFQCACLVDPEASVDHHDEDIASRLSRLPVCRTLNARRIEFSQNLLLLGIGQVAERLVLDVPLTPFVIRRVIAEPLGIAADFVELADLQTNRYILDAAPSFEFDPAEQITVGDSVQGDVVKVRLEAIGCCHQRVVGT